MHSSWSFISNDKDGEIEIINAMMTHLAHSFPSNQKRVHKTTSICLMLNFKTIYSGIVPYESTVHKFHSCKNRCIKEFGLRL